MTTPGSEQTSGAGPEVLEILLRGEMTVHGRITGSSNATLLASCTLEGEELLCVYKPARGERPLWDFPAGLHQRETAAYLLSEALSWGIVPETVERAEAPFGEGSVQRFVHEDGEAHYFTLRDDPRWHDPLVKIAAFDIVANSADRKSGHVLLERDRLFGIDNGLSFHEEPKLRTVIWDFAGEVLPEDLRGDLERFAWTQLPQGLGELLSAAERDALLWRTERLIDLGHLPSPEDDGEWPPPYPWPLV